MDQSKLLVRILVQSSALVTSFKFHIVSSFLEVSLQEVQHMNTQPTVLPAFLSVRPSVRKFHPATLLDGFR